MTTQTTQTIRTAIAQTLQAAKTIRAEAEALSKTEGLLKAARQWDAWERTQAERFEMEEVIALFEAHAKRLHSRIAEEEMTTRKYDRVLKAYTYHTTTDRDEANAVAKALDATVNASFTDEGKVWVVQGVFAMPGLDIEHLIKVGSEEETS